MIDLTHGLFRVIVVLSVLTALLTGGRADAKDLPDLPQECKTGILVGEEGEGGPKKDLLIKDNQVCHVSKGTHGYRNVHIWNGGKLVFSDEGEHIHFWATAILVEKDGSLLAGTSTAPIGINKGTLTIHLYGAPQNRGGKGVRCQTGDMCGVPADIWTSNLNDHGHPGDPALARKVDNPAFAASAKDYRGPKDDYFYAYHPLFHDEGDDKAYFGYKVLGVSHGGTLELYGKKGACPKDCALPSTTGESWVRLNKTVSPNDAGAKTTLVVDSPVDWKADDWIVVTTTDYLPGHSELLQIEADTSNGTTVTVKQKVTYHHNGERYPIPSDAVSRLGLSTEVAKGAETRAGVALLSRSIRIVSGGSALNDDFPLETSPDCANPHPETNAKCYFGAHAVFRQGFTSIKVQGVEFYQMGQGGRIGHYPVHFHHARKTNSDTFVVDSSIWDSMTRWIVLHGTHDVTLARNVGYLSIGHGFYLEDGTEINNSLFANIGIFARGAVNNKQNPRKVPGILAAPDLDTRVNLEAFPYKSDYDHPTVFWIMNGWNDFQYNMAAGAGTCGACYWLVGGYNSTMSRTVDKQGQRWESYASLQDNVDRAATTPLKSFIGNSCASAMTSFQTITKTEACIGVGPSPNDGFPSLPHIPNPLAAKADPPDLTYYPSTKDGGRFPTQCGGPLADAHADCRTSPPRCSAENRAGCLVTVLDHYTTSFNWAAFNFAAIWLRPQWYLVTDSVITDVQQAGLTIVTGGGYSASDVITGHWALVRKSVFIGHTQEEKATSDKPPILMPDNPFASNGGPFNLTSKLRCAENAGGNRPGNHCLSVDEGVSVQVSNFGMYQRLFSVYDGPAFQDSNAYLNIKRREIDDCKPFPSTVDASTPDGRCDPADLSVHRQSAWLAGVVQGLPKATKTVDSKPVDFCYMPNAAIGWKQPNGFYYPPAFHSTNLYFAKDDAQGKGGVDVRHFVVSPLFKEGTFTTDTLQTGQSYCNWSRTLFDGFAGNDRQTVLNDDDGSLTGYTRSISVNLDDFFLAPVQAIECRSDETARMSPYDYVTTVLYPRCVIDKTCAKAPNPPPPDGDGNPNLNNGDWNRACTNELCYGVPLYRQDLMPIGDVDPTDKNKTLARSIRMMGQETGQRSSLTVDRGTYYLDTAVGKARQLECKGPECVINLFQKNQTYYLFLIFAKDTTEQTYRFYVGKDTDFKPDSVVMVQANIGPNPVVFKNLGLLPAGRARWFDEAQGVVEVTVKVADLPDLAKKVADAKEKKCQPATFCTWNKDKKTCNDCSYDDKGNCKDSGSDKVCRWAIADLDCPDEGCFGIAFTLPEKFATDPTPDPRPAATCLQRQPPWNVSLEAREANDGVCPQKSDKLLDDFCQVK